MKKVLFAIILSFITLYVSAQKEINQYDPENTFEKGVLLFESQHYASALECFEQYISFTDDQNRDKVIMAKYYEAASTLFLEESDGEKRKFKLKVPWFIPGFLIAAAIVTYLPCTATAGGFLKEVSKYLMVFTLFIIGANLSRKKLKELGIRPLIHGVLLWLILSTVWCVSIYFNWVKA